MKALSGLIALALGACLVPRPAAACGGFFCSATNPVNQAAERIIFAQNGNDTVTAVIEIQYQGPSTSFSWLLPVSGVPDQIGIASTAAFQLLQQRTNPQYNLTVRVEGTCAQEPSTGKGVNLSGGFNSGPNASQDLAPVAALRLKPAASLARSNGPSSRSTTRWRTQRRRP